MTNIIQKIIDNKDKIVRIRINGDYYDIDYISVDGVSCYDQLENNDVILHCYLTDTDSHVTENYYFDVEDIKSAKEIKLYKLEEI